MEWEVGLSIWEVNDAATEQNEGTDVVDVIPAKLSWLIPGLDAKLHCSVPQVQIIRVI